MTNHDSAFKLRALLSQIAPEFTDLTADVSDVMKHADNPMLLAAVLYKMAQERKRTNDLLAQMEAKYDELAFQIKTSGMSPTTLPTPNPILAPSISLLPAADQRIMSLFETQTSLDAQVVKKALGYKNPNAASQRLNALVKQGHLGKIQSGKKVVFVKTNA